MVFPSTLKVAGIVDGSHWRVPPERTPKIVKNCPDPLAAELISGSSNANVAKTV
jgi:hypothetical protein